MPDAAPPPVPVPGTSPEATFESRPASRVRQVLARLARNPRVRIRPRVSLAAGSLMVLLTLFIPLTQEACGPNRTGLEFIRGRGAWVGLMGLISNHIEWAFYVLTLLMAAGTLAMVLVSVRRDGPPVRPRTARVFLALATTLALYWALDVFAFGALGILGAGVFDPLAFTDETSLAVLAAAALAVIALCLRARLLRAERWALGLFEGAALISLTLSVNYYLSLFSSRPLLDSDSSVQLLVLVVSLYWLVPAGLWFRFGLSEDAARQGRWPRLRSQIVWLLLPGAAYPFLYLDEARAGRWGYLPFFTGVLLIFAGAWQLERRPVTPGQG